MIKVLYYSRNNNQTDKKMMTFNKIQKGTYSFKGIDTWNGKEIEGTIEHRPFDVELKHQWQVRSNNDTIHRDESLKACKKWLTN